MAGSHGQSPLSLKDELLAHGQRFSFFQSLRLLNLLLDSNKNESSSVQVTPELSLAFPATDVSSISELPDSKGYHVTATFLGLYGVSSPLPSFYTEDMFQERRENSSVTRDFADIIHRRLFQLLYASWQKYHLNNQIAEEKSVEHADIIFALAGIRAPGQSDISWLENFSMLRYTGLMGSFPRSALGLQVMLADFLAGDEVEIIACLPRTVKISRDQQLNLGSDDNGLGMNSFLGSEMIDYQGKFRIRIGPLGQDRFGSLLPGGKNYKTLTKLVQNYLVDPLDYDVELIVSGKELRQTSLGGMRWSRLGLDTVLFTGEHIDGLNIIFPAEN